MSHHTPNAQRPRRESIHGLSGTEYRLLAARVISSGRHFTRVKLANDKVVDVNRIHGVVEPGDDVFVTGRLIRDESRRKRTTAWAIAASLLSGKSRQQDAPTSEVAASQPVKKPSQSDTPKPPPPPPRPTKPLAANPARRFGGEVTRVHPSQAFGEIIEANSGRAYFVHHSELPSATPLMEGLRLSFQAVDTPRGVKAIHCQAI